MPNFSANLSLMFNEHHFSERFQAAYDAGFDGVEYLFPYEHKGGDIARELNRLNLIQTLFNLPPGDWANGERGIAALPGRENEFKKSVDIALKYAEITGCKYLHVMAGNIASNLSIECMMQTYQENLHFAAQKMADAGITLVIEPINTRDMPNYFLNYQTTAYNVVHEIGEPNIGIQMDFYHTQIMEGDILKTYKKHKEKVKYIQIASIPDRTEPNTGEINYPWLFEKLDEIPYKGWIGCEYHPKINTESGLEWFRQYASR